MNERKSNVIPLFAAQPEATPISPAASEITKILSVIDKLSESEVGKIFRERIMERVVAWREDLPEDEDADEYVLDRLNEIIDLHPALQIALGRRTMHATTEPYDPFPHL